MLRAACLTLVVALGAGIVAHAPANFLPHPVKLDRVQRAICGCILDYTRNHGKDRRLYWPSLERKGDLYVYLPPGYDPSKQYPLAIYLHGFLSDELSFLEHVVKPIDKAISSGKLAPMVIAAPDATPHGFTCFNTTGTFYLNSRMGRFEDYLVHDIYDFLMKNYSIRPEPEAHALLGVSMGGSAAFNKVMKYRDRFGIATAFAPPLNLRWMSCRCCYFDNFDPKCWGWREDFSDGSAVIGSFYNGLVKIRIRTLLYPLHGKDNPHLTQIVSHDNPVEMLERLDIRPGFAEFYIGYGGEDEFNIDAQVDSFLYRARQRGIEVTSDFLPEGRHNSDTAVRLLPGMLEWLATKMERFRPK